MSASFDRVPGREGPSRSLQRQDTPRGSRQLWVSYKFHRRGLGVFPLRIEPGAERIVTLNEKHEVEDLHAPPDGEIVSEIASQYGVHCCGELEALCWAGENLDELRPVPC